MDEQTNVPADTQEATVGGPQATAEQDAPDLTLQDLASIKTIVDVAAQRGTFKPGEMEAVGKIYNKLSAFLASVSKTQGQKENG
jgi:hypothetical protein